MRLLVVEDDKALCDTLHDVLSSKNIEIDIAYNGSNALEKIISQKYEILLLDINLPQISGFEILQEARQYHPHIGALFMTALDTPTHLEKSFQAGGDDYIRKPFTIAELLYRIEAVYKRICNIDTTMVTIDNTFTFDLTQNLLLYKGKTYDLKPKLRKLLYIFALNANKTIEKSIIEQTLWENEELPDPAILRIYIKELREILGKERIITVKGVGYRLETL